MTLALRTAPLEWAWREQADPAGDLTWVDSDLSVMLHCSITAPALVAATQGRPRATVFDALGLLFAHIEAEITALPWWWTAASPAPDALTRLGAAAGIDPSLHEGRTDLLSVMRGLLTGWTRRRGEPTMAASLLRRMDRAAEARWLEPLGARCVAVSARGAWTARSQGGPRLSGGVLLETKGESRDGATLLGWHSQAPPPAHALRLLPVWIEIALTRAAPAPERRAEGGAP